jgi:hypothetical protein
MSVVKISQLNPANSVGTEDTFVLVQSGLTLKTTADLMFDAVTSARDLADKTYVGLAINSAINNLINGAPTILNTLNELATAIDNDPNFAATIITQINAKVSTSDFNTLFDTQFATKTEPTFNAVYLNSAITASNQAVTKEYVDDATSGIAESATTAQEGYLYGRTDSAEYIQAEQEYPETTFLFWEDATNVIADVPNAILLKNGYVDSEFAQKCRYETYPIGSQVYVKWDEHPSRGNSQEIYLGTILGYDVNTVVSDESGMYVSNPNGFNGVGGDGGGSNLVRHRLTYSYVRVVVNFQDGANVALGYQAMNNLNTGGKNLVLGYKAGQSITDGANLIILGAGAEPSSGIATNEITLGNADITKTRLRGALEVGGSTGTTGQILTSTGPSTAPEWTDITELTDTAIQNAIENIVTNVTNTNNDFAGDNSSLSNSTSSNVFAVVAYTGSYNDLLDKPSINNGGSITSTTDLPEGTNLYFTTARARASLSGGTGISYNSSTGVISLSGGLITSTADVSEDSSHLYYTDARARAALSGGTGISYNSSTGVISLSGGLITSTADVTEDPSHLYYTDARARASLSGGTGITYNSSTGVIGLTSNSITIGSTSISLGATAQAVVGLVNVRSDRVSYSSNGVSKVYTYYNPDSDSLDTVFE